MRNSWIAVGLLWLAGVGLRLTILAVPPVILLIQTDLSLSGTEVGILSGLPVILFGIAALPGSLLVARFGALATLVAGLLIAGVVSGLRGAVLNVAVLYAATIVMSAGIAIMQPALSPLVRQWLPKRVTFGTAVYTNGLLVGETLAVMLTIPLVLPLAGGSWRWAFAIWGIPLVMIAILTLALAGAAEGGFRHADGWGQLVAGLP
jgi:CP family cyanate transporter-like MFS transporter